MKILLNASIRTRSKWVSNNVYKYIRVLGETHSSWPISDVFTQSIAGKLWIDNHIDFDGQHLTIGKEPVLDIHAETIMRLEHLKKSNLNMCIKIHPTTQREMDMITELKKFCKYYFTLSRKDLFEQAMSATLGYVTNEWVSGNKQNEVIEKFKLQPIKIDPLFWEGIIKSLKKQGDYLENEKSHKFIYMEDTLTIRDAKDFCEMLNLEYRNFELDHLFDLEYGNNKKDMITNFEELRIIYEKTIIG